MFRISFVSVLSLFAFGLQAPAQPYGLTERPEVGPFLNDHLPESAPTVSGDWSAVPAFPDLYFTNAVGLAAIPGTNLLVVWEREGRVWSFLNDSNATQKTLVLDLSGQCQGWDDSGLLGLAFHPGFSTNRQMWVYYNWRGGIEGGAGDLGPILGDENNRPPTQTPTRNRLSRFVLDANFQADLLDEYVVIDQKSQRVWHNGGGLFFHPDNGFLYLTNGDDADAALNTQRIDLSLFSGVLRIDVDRRGGAISHPPPKRAFGEVSPEWPRYYVPNDNPFVGEPGALEEFFCLGLRSPHRMTVDPQSGRIFIGDVGAGTREEISVIDPGESGLNFQWARIEGLNGDLVPPYVGINRRPILDYGHDEGFAVIGGYVYRGGEFADELGGRYIFGDNGSRVVWVLDESTVPAGKIPLCVVPQGGGPNPGNDYTGLSSFGVDADNELYMCQLSSVGGRIYKLVRSGPPPASRPLPTLLSQTGAFADPATLTATNGLIPYSVNSPLWSDAAVKTRWMAVPTNTTVGFAPSGEWAFPEGTVFVKHFALATNDTDPSQLRRLETRLLVRDTNGTVYGATYKWRPDHSDADLVATLLNEDVLITTATGTRTQVWSYPGRQDCLRCHTTASGGVLGVNTRQLNGDFTYPSNSVTDNQLRALNHIGILDPPLAEAAIPAYTRIVPVTDTNAPLETRVRSYLDANCAHCHRPGGVPAFIDTRFDTPLNQQGLINGLVVDPLGIAGAKVVAPQDLERSILYQRDNSLSGIKMPPLAKNTIDTGAMAVLEEWILSLPIPPPLTVMAGATPSAPGPAPQLIQFTAEAGGGNLGGPPVDSTDDQTGMVSAQGENAAFQEGAVQAFDNQVTTKWLDFANGNPSTRASWIQYVYPAGARPRVTQYTITSANDAPERDPGDWRLLGSNDDGTTWSTLDVRTNQAFAGRFERRSFSFTNVSGYSLYRLQIDRVANPAIANSVQLAELEFISEPFATYAWAFGDGTTSSEQNPSHTYTSNGIHTAAVLVSDGINTAAESLWLTIGGVASNLALKVNFQPAGTPLVPAGHVADFGEVFGDRGNGLHYGWNTDNTENTRQRNSVNSPDARYDTLNHMQKPDGATLWEIALPSGGYQVRMVSGDPDHFDGTYRIAAEEALFLDGQPTDAERFFEAVGSVIVNDGRLSLGNHPGSVNNKVNFLEIVALPEEQPAWQVDDLHSTGSGFHLTLLGTNGVYYVVEATTNLIDWSPISTNLSVSNRAVIVDPVATNHPVRFYRARAK